MNNDFHSYDVIVIGGGRSAALTKQSFVRRYAPEPWNGELGARKWPPAGD